MSIVSMNETSFADKYLTKHDMPIKQGVVYYHKDLYTLLFYEANTDIKTIFHNSKVPLFLQFI